MGSCKGSCTLFCGTCTWSGLVLSSPCQIILCSIQHKIALILAHPPAGCKCSLSADHMLRVYALITDVIRYLFITLWASACVAIVLLGRSGFHAYDCTYLFLPFVTFSRFISHTACQWVLTAQNVTCMGMSQPFPLKCESSENFAATTGLAANMRGMDQAIGFSMWRMEPRTSHSQMAATWRWPLLAGQMRCVQQHARVLQTVKELEAGAYSLYLTGPYAVPPHGKGRLSAYWHFQVDAADQQAVMFWVVLHNETGRYCQKPIKAHGIQ